MVALETRVTVRLIYMGSVEKKKKKKKKNLKAKQSDTSAFVEL